MELIVKIGADQQGLRQTVDRMKAEFRNMNASVPLNWQGAQAANARFGNILQGGGMGGGFGAGGLDGGRNPFAGMEFLAKRAMGALRTQIYGMLAQLAIDALDKLGPKFWELVYGLDDRTTAIIIDRHKALTGKVKALLDSRQSLEAKVHESLIENATPRERARILNEDRGAADSEVERLATKLRNAKQDLAQATDIFGNQLEPYQKAKLVADVANAEIELNKAREKQIEVTNRAMKAVNESVEVDKNKRDEAKKKALELFKQNEGRPSFAADSMAQAGLFSRSALLFNPDFSTSQAQLGVLIKIEANTRAQGGWAP